MFHHQQNVNLTTFEEIDKFSDFFKCLFRVSVCEFTLNAILLIIHTIFSLGQHFLKLQIKRFRQICKKLV